MENATDLRKLESFANFLNEFSPSPTPICVLMPESIRRIDLTSALIHGVDSVSFFLYCNPVFLNDIDFIETFIRI